MLVTEFLNHCLWRQVGTDTLMIYSRCYEGCREENSAVDFWVDHIILRRT